MAGPAAAEGGPIVQMSDSFEWGAADCFAFVTGRAGIDTSHMPPRTYTGRIGAARYIKRLGFNSLADLMDSLMTPKPVGFAQRGDVLLKDGCLGICKGTYGLFLAETGYTRVATVVCERAWAS